LCNKNVALFIILLLKLITQWIKLCPSVCVIKFFLIKKEVKMKIRKSLFVGVVALGLSPLALANGTGYMPAAPVMTQADSWAQGVYVGLQLGYGMTNWDNLADAVSNSDAFAGRFDIGYDFHKNFAVELGYAQFFNSPSIDAVEGDLYGNTYAIDLMLKIKADIVDNFGLYAKIGGAYMNTCEGDYTDSVSNFNVAYGAGAYYDITKNLSMDISWMRYNGDSSISDLGDGYQPYADLFAVGIQYKFII
jgi:opacity protein-like surface antigen